MNPSTTDSYIDKIKQDHPDALISTYTGKRVDLFNFKIADVDIQDIAHHLSNLCRFTGAVRNFYSVAQHCVYVSGLIGGPTMALMGLLHDAAEAYVNDLSTPIKHSGRVQEYVALEEQIQRVIMLKFGLPHNADFETRVKAADTTAYEYEKHHLFNNPTSRLYCYTPDEAKKIYLDKYYALTFGRNNQ